MKRLAWLVLVAAPSLAYAGGFEIPDNTTEALGRAGAFTAKADNPSAIQYNVAGLARQRGTRLLLDINLVFHDRTFTRAGNYPEAPSAEEPYGGQPYPTISNLGGPQIAPFLGITTDFGKLERWTFAIGAYGPSSYGKREYPTTVTVANGSTGPNPGRYDVQKADLLIIYPTLAAAVRITKWFDLGLALHLVVAHFNLANTSFVDLGRSLCPVAEAARCDSTTALQTSGFAATASLGMKFTPIKALNIGVNLKGPATVETHGEVTASSPPAMPLVIDPNKVTFISHLPWQLRLGIRWAFLKEDGFEHGDVEVDGIYEAWQDAEGVGSQIKIPELSIFSDINPVITHHYRDTFGLRVGGSYNARLPKGVFTVRLGFAFDSAATHVADTRLDFNTGAKYVPAIGFGYKIRGVTINIAYAYMFEPDRTVTNGDIRAINGTNGTNQDALLKPLPVVNNGVYTAQTQTASIGLTIDWDEALKKQRKLTYDQ